MSEPALAHAVHRPDGTYLLHTVEEHARAVAELAADFAAPFGGQDWARAAGLWHDLGKHHPDFQRYIRKATGYDAQAHIETAPGRVDHSTLGAVHAWDRPGGAGRLLAYLIAGHHAGLPDMHGSEAALLPRVDRQRPRLAAALAGAPAEVRGAGLPRSAPLGGREGIALWLRMLFSCLVDADFLDTEQFMSPARAALRGGAPDLAALKARLDAALAEMGTAAVASPVNRIRAEVLRHCREAARWAPGPFTLTVPTGGGKTLSSLAFALEHARLHGKRRVVYVIPYTSIIEQTADVFRRALERPEDAVPAVLEHHSSVEAERETPHSRLAAENWDAPVVVTTSVQFWESLFAARTSRARKLHNLVESVIVLDEAQLLPPEFLRPSVAALQTLCDQFGATVLLCTATQPALQEEATPDLRFPRLSGVREIVENPDALHDSLRRVRVHVPEDLRAPSPWEEIAARLREHRSVLCVVGRRADARELFQALLPDPTAVHLSALMCGAHRAHELAGIRARLKAGEPVRVVSTQLVEAGVDVDFPVVFRALAGLDSLAQAAGRCNREGRLRDADGRPVPGEVHVFVPPRPAPPGLLRFAEEGGRLELERRAEDPLTPVRFREYFRRLYWMHGDALDAHGIVAMLTPGEDLGIRFRAAAEAFRLIDDGSVPVVVRYAAPGSEGSEPVLDRLRFAPPDRDSYRRLQRYIVTVPGHAHRQLVAAGHVEELHPGLFVQVTTDLYHPQFGLRLRDDAEEALAHTLTHPV